MGKEEDVIMVHIYIFNIGILKYIKQILPAIKAEIDSLQ